MARKQNPRLQRSIVAGIRTVITSQAYLNKINVFPVADGDTGTNMALTLSAILDGTYNRKFTDIHHLLDVVADCALNGARGNSGTILAQFFVGLSEGAKNVRHRFTTKNFVAAVSTASNYAHKALSEPKEGTILTVMREFSDSITQAELAHSFTDFTALLECGLASANIALVNTQFQLKELKKAGVVDAGALGFINFLQGIHDFTESGSIKDFNQEELDVLDLETPPEIHADIDEAHRFCTECIIKGNLNLNSLRHQLDAIGNCVIIAGSEKKAKIHIHTNSPQAVFKLCRQHGEISREKADDMILQQQTTLTKDNHIAIVTDSGADFPDGTVSRLNIHVVPLTITLDNNNFIDKVSISPGEFYQILRQSDNLPQTSQPSLGEFKRQYNYLTSHYKKIIAIHIPSALSGTYNASCTAAQSVAKDDITLIDSCNVAAGAGLIVTRAAEAAAQGLSHDEITNIIRHAIDNTRMYIVLNNLRYVVKGGRLPKKISYLFRLLKLRPILTTNANGKIKLAGVLRLNKPIAEKLAQVILKKTNPNCHYHMVITHTDCLEQAQQLQQHLSEQLQNLLSLEIVECAPVLGAHAGPDSLAVAIQTVPSNQITT